MEKTTDVKVEIDASQSTTDSSNDSKVSDGTTEKKSGFQMDGPDGGWAWCVALAACSVTFIIAGLARMSGIMYVAYIEEFHISRQAAAYPSTIRASTKNLLGPVVGIIGQQYGVRAVTLAGGVIASISAAACYFAWNMDFIVVVWGGLNGIACAFTVTLLQVVIGQHFKKHHSTASGLSFSGGCFGSFVFPVLIEYLLRNYGLQGTFLIISAISMHIIPAAMVLRKPIWLKSQRFVVNDNQDDSKSELLVTDSKCQQKVNGCVGKECAKIDIPEDSRQPMSDQESEPDRASFKWYDRDRALVIEAVSIMVRASIKDTSKVDGYDKDVSFYAELANEPVPSWIPEVVDEIYKTAATKQTSERSELDITLNGNAVDAIAVMKSKVKSGLVETIGEFTNGAATESFVKELMCAKKLSEDEVKELLAEIDEVCRLAALESCEGHSESTTVAINGNCVADIQGNSETPSQKFQLPIIKKDGFREHFKTALKLNYNPFFILVCLCRVVHFVTFVPFVTVLVDYGIDKGLPEDDGKYIIAALSAGDLVGRIGMGWITDRNCLSLPKFMMCAMITQGALTTALPLVQARYMLMITVALFGMFVGAVFIRHPVLISKYLDRKEQSIAMGCINFVPGIIGFGLPPFIGYFRDTLGSYDKMFFITGSIAIFVGFLWLLEPQLAKCAPPREDDVDGHDTAVPPE